VRTANARNPDILGRPRTPWESMDFGLRTTDYGLLAVRKSWEVLYSLYIEGRNPVQLSRSIKSFSVALNTSFIVRNNMNHGYRIIEASLELLENSSFAE
jgi:hypothetical protein